MPVVWGRPTRLQQFRLGFWLAVFAVICLLIRACFGTRYFFSSAFMAETPFCGPRHGFSILSKRGKKLFTDNL